MVFAQCIIKFKKKSINFILFWGFCLLVLLVFLVVFYWGFLLLFFFCVGGLQLNLTFSSQEQHTYVLTINKEYMFVLDWRGTQLICRGSVHGAVD